MALALMVALVVVRPEGEQPDDLDSELAQAVEEGLPAKVG